jgi:Skp family chaperone for outer membrane proteins
MEKRISKFVSPDLSGFDKKLAVLTEQMTFLSKEFKLYTAEIEIIKQSADETAGYARDVKNGLRQDINRIEKIVDQVEDDIKETESDVRELIDIAEGRFENKRDALQNDYNQKADTIRTDVDRKLTDLETRLNKKLQRALDNPLAN